MSPKLDDSTGWNPTENFPLSAHLHPERSFSAYVHIPFCYKRCGYCDFTTFTNAELGGGASAYRYADDMVNDIRQTADLLEKTGFSIPALHTIFFGGGTPTFLPVEDLIKIKNALVQVWGVKTNIEITTEANPDTVNRVYLEQIAQAGFTRLSLGMQSADPEILQILDRSHDSKRVEEAVLAAKQLGLEVSLDIIYATPGETLAQWEYSLCTALQLEPDHLSCYALGIEPGTKIGAKLKQGKIQAVDDDIAADFYMRADEMLQAAGYQWYEVSNWARNNKVCKHNLAYWHNENWWGFGPGAHSHLGNWRGWNVRHPRAWKQKLQAGQLALLGAEVLSAAQNNMEQVMLALRIASGIELKSAIAQGIITNNALSQAEFLVSQGWLSATEFQRGYAVATVKGRLMLDSIVNEFLE